MGERRAIEGHARIKIPHAICIRFLGECVPSEMSCCLIACFVRNHYSRPANGFSEILALTNLDGDVTISRALFHRSLVKWMHTASSSDCLSGISNIHLMETHDKSTSAKQAYPLPNEVSLPQKNENLHNHH